MIPVQLPVQMAVIIHVQQRVRMIVLAAAKTHAILPVWGLVPPVAIMIALVFVSEAVKVGVIQPAIRFVLVPVPPSRGIYIKGTSKNPCF